MMKSHNTLILGAGMTGLTAGWASGLPVYEVAQEPGGICSSYYMRPGSEKYLSSVPNDSEAYRFEIGGGHWIFGSDPLVLRFLRSLTPLKSYERKSSVFFPHWNIFVPYPIQHHLGYLGKDIASKALVEMLTSPKRNPETMDDWLYSTFGPTLTDLFFAPFHERYTAGLWNRIAPQDPYKSPIIPASAIQGAFERTSLVGYNATFVYPVEGLNVLAQRLAERCHIHYGKQVIQIDAQKKELLFADGDGLHYNLLISTLPLNKMLEITGLQVMISEQPDPYTSVLVLNLGAERGPKCPDEHWVYLPHSQAGFYRVGFYSNVDSTFLPASAREDNNRVSVYVERAFAGVKQLPPVEIETYTAQVVEELQKWGWIGKTEAINATWIDVAYTWSWPSSRWREKALALLEKQGIIQAGRYGRWVFQGIAESVKEGNLVGALFSEHRRKE